MMDTSDATNKAATENASRNPALDVGATLRAARERLGMSVHDVAERIKFAPRQVEALEANDFGHLPEAAFVRGFVRSYARVLQLDEAALIAALPGGAPKSAPGRPQSAVNVAFPSGMMRQRINLPWFAGALVIALALAVFLVLPKSQPVGKQAGTVFEPVPLPPAVTAESAVAAAEVQHEPGEPAKGANPAESVKPANNASEKEAVKPARISEQKKVSETRKPAKEQVEPVKPAEHAAPETVKPAQISEPNKAPEPGKVAATRKPVKPLNTGNAASAVPVIAAASAPAATSKPAIPLEVLMRRPLHFVFAATMFAQVIDVKGNVLLSRTVAGGDEKWIGGPGRAPYDVTLSMPGKAKLFYRGKEIDLSAYPSTETANFKVQ
jgi:cytoskeleton protein RodZ